MNTFGGMAGRTSASLFEIRLDSEVIVVNCIENANQLLRGVVVLCLPVALKVKDVHLRMTGNLVIGWKDKGKDKVIDTRPFSHLVEKSTEIFSHKWPSFVGGGHHDQFNKETVLPPGNYEWPFELVMNGSMAETIEGLTNSHITYKLEATVMRGKLGQNMHVSKPVRIVRTPDPTLLELGHPVTVEDVWSNKIDYQFRLPQRAVAFGTAIPIEMWFTPLLKGLRMGTISCVLHESQEFTPLEATSNTEKSSTRQRDVDSWEFELNNDEHHILDENGQDGYALGKMLPLPKQFRRCVQDADVWGIKIRHSVKCRLALHNPDGHISELRATLPITIFISPNLSLNTDGCLRSQAQQRLQVADIILHPPPQYGKHILDLLYPSTDQSDGTTPESQSRISSPVYNPGRSGLLENLGPLDGSVYPTSTPPLIFSFTLPSFDTTPRNTDLRRRLSGLRSRNRTVNGGSGLSDYRPHQAEHIGGLNGHTYDENYGGVMYLTSSQDTPEHLDYPDVGDINKVPSYSTALRAPIPSPASSAVLPDYVAAVSVQAS
ncbi:hypothetical protein OIDMADRAFT_173646 [Oidiodendron maius Zn]|uniref:Arrestin C-terminal-like domain-containing protein n=1 Tax=Oidiodendron maius (strain Zn) TaxID=913774 RepID=A0A0C3CT71_OIDMZ|nr:hypothetical protein OIDMADRAFT_173646 [Oidiodendron maius Zn]